MNKIKKILDLNEIKIDGLILKIKNRIFLYGIALIGVIAGIIVHYAYNDSNSYVIKTELSENQNVSFFSSGFHKINRKLNQNNLSEKGITLSIQHFTIMFPPKIREVQDPSFLYISYQGITDSVEIPVSQFEYEKEAIILNNSETLPFDIVAGLLFFIATMLLCLIISASITPHNT